MLIRLNSVEILIHQVLERNHNSIFLEILWLYDSYDFQTKSHNLSKSRHHIMHSSMCCVLLQNMKLEFRVFEYVVLLTVLRRFVRCSFVEVRFVHCHQYLTFQVANAFVTLAVCLD